MIARAETLDGKVIEGQYCVYRGYPTMFDEYGMNGKEIKPETLEYKVGDEWYSMEELTDIVLNGSW